MPMYNLIEYIDNYSKASKILWQYWKDEQAINAVNGNDVDFNAANATTNSFKIKGKITGETFSDDTKSVEIMVPLKYLSNFSRPLEMHLINCE